MKVVGCILEYQAKFLLLHRANHKPEGGAWALPGGKIETGESEQNAVIRELFEETGYQADTAELERLGDFDIVSVDGIPVNFAVFIIQIDQPHTVILETESHQDYKWVTAEDFHATPNVIYELKVILEKLGYISNASKPDSLNG